MINQVVLQLKHTPGAWVQNDWKADNVQSADGSSQPVHENILAACLKINPAGSFQFEDDLLAAQKRRTDTPQLPDAHLDLVRETHQVAMVDGVGFPFRKFDRMDSAETTDQEGPVPAAAQHLHAGAHLEAAGTAPGRLDHDALLGSEKRLDVDKDPFSALAEWIRIDLSQEAGGQKNLAFIVD